MGLGDWILATGQVKTMYEQDPRPVSILGPGARAMWSEVFDGNPKISRRGGQILLNGPGNRPYIAGKNDKRWTWRLWPIRAGEIFLSLAEREFGQQYAGRALIEPNTKVVGGNKSWPLERWQQVANATQGAVQVGRADSPRLNGVEFVPTTFRQALGVLAACRVFVGSEGALHHAAAALNVPAVVLYSHFISPEVTGYTEQVNLRHASGIGCGSRHPCAECAQSMLRITSEEVIESLR